MVGKFRAHPTVPEFTVGKLATMGYVCIVGDYSTHLCRTGITVWLGLIFVGISVLKGLKLTCMNESGPVLLMP